jgi:hypothetical protein
MIKSLADHHDLRGFAFTAVELLGQRVQPSLAAEYKAQSRDD